MSLCIEDFPFFQQPLVASLGKKRIPTSLKEVPAKLAILHYCFYEPLRKARMGSLLGLTLRMLASLGNTEKALGTFQRVLNPGAPGVPDPEIVGLPSQA